MFVQLIAFRARPGAQLLPTLERAGAFLRAQPGFMGRDVFVDADGTWHGVLQWADVETCEAAGHAWQVQPAAAELDDMVEGLHMTTAEGRHHDAPRFVAPSQDTGRRLVDRHLDGAVDMLNLLRFRDVADYGRSPELAPGVPESGRDAYRRYAVATMPMLAASGAKVLYSGAGGGHLIGPPHARWDHVLIVRHRDPATFLGFASSPAYLAIAGHRTAALDDSRLLPMQAAGI